MITLRSIVRLQPLASSIIKQSIYQKPPTHLNAICCSASVRQYAKGKDKMKERSRDKGYKFAKIEFNDDQLREFFNLDGYTGQLEKCIDTMRNEFIKNLSLRSTTGSIETLKIKVDGKDHELQELAQIIRKNPKIIVINMVAFPQTIPVALQAIQKSGMNLNPQQDGTTIYIPVPKITKEHRENLSKNAKTLFFKCRDSIKDAQNGVVKKVKNQTELSTDESFSIQGQVVGIADKYIREAEDMLEVKQKELLGKD